VGKGEAAEVQWLKMITADDYSGGLYENYIVGKLSQETS
jgi:hypothetical protein